MPSPSQDPETDQPTLPAPLPLNAMLAGGRGVVIRLAGGGGLLSRMASMGFTPGAEVLMMQNYGFGPLIASVRGCRVALGRSEAGGIFVQILPSG